MTNKLINNLLIVLIIICSTSFFSLSAIGSGQKAFELAGIVLIIVLIGIHLAYSKEKYFRQNFGVLIGLIFLSFATSVLMANFSRDQSISETIYAQRALFYYLFYFLLHQLKIDTKDLEKIFIGFGIWYIFIYLVQYFAYPKLIFDALIMNDRGTIRIYISGLDYLAVCYFIGIQGFLRTNKLKYLIFTLLNFSIFILQGGRQTIVLMALLFLIAILFSKRVKSRTVIIFLVLLCSGLVFFLFQGIFKEMFTQSQYDIGKGSNYVRYRTIMFYLHDFSKTAWAYITGNGMFSSESGYGKEMLRLYTSKGYYLGDVGIIGMFAVFGIFFIIALLGFFIKIFSIKIQNAHFYIKYMFIGVLISLATSNSFTESAFICMLCGLLYILDVSHHQVVNEIPAQIQENTNT
jgi:hypothetical protein